PAYWRMKLELEGYAVNMLVDHLTVGLTDTRVSRYVSYFTGPDYYWMWPFGSNIRKRLMEIRDRLVSGKFDTYELELIAWMYEHRLAAGPVRRARDRITGLPEIDIPTRR